MFLTKKHLSRRTVLKGAGVAVGLPLLDAMIPAATALAQTAAAPKLKRGLLLHPARRDSMEHGVRRGNGSVDSERRRRGFQAERDSGAAREPEAIRHVVLASREQANAEFRARDRAGDVVVAACVPTRHRRVHGDTIDQIIAERIGQETALPSLEVASETTTQVAAGPPRWLLLPYNVLCRTPTRRCRWNSIRARYSRSCSAKVTRPTNARRSRENEEHPRHDRGAHAAAFTQDLGASDRIVLDNYLDTVREIERRVEKAARATSPG